MIQYYRGTEQDMEALFSAFQAGFIDYMIKFNFTREQFAAHFFGPEGNALEHSFVAMRGEEAVGVILGGIRDYEGIRTMRCGALAVRSELRGQGVSRELFRLHLEEAVNQGCRQLYLEVIVGNDRAVSFYNNLGYHKVYDLSYYTLADVSSLGILQSKDGLNDIRLSIRQLDREPFEKSINGWNSCHLNWQNDLDYISQVDKYVYYGAYINDRLIGAMAITPQGRISVLIVDRDYRGQGAAQLLLTTAIRELALAKLQISFSNNALMEGFLNHLGFQKDAVGQYEMYRFL